MIRVSAPADRDGIGQAVADALAIDVFDVVLRGDELHITNADGREADALAVVNGYTPPPPPPDPETELDAALAAAAAKATTAEKIDALIAALRGTAGPGAEPRRPQ